MPNKGFRLVSTSYSITLPYESFYFCDLLRDLATTEDMNTTTTTPTIDISNMVDEHNFGCDNEEAVEVDLSSLGLSALALQFIASTIAALLLSKDVNWLIRRAQQWHEREESKRVPDPTTRPVQDITEALLIKTLLCSAVALDFIGCSHGSELIGDYVAEIICTTQPQTMCEEWFGQEFATIRVREVDAIHVALCEAVAL